MMDVVSAKKMIKQKGKVAGHTWSGGAQAGIRENVESGRAL